MLQRFKIKNILKSLQHFPAVGVIGLRQVGKTTLVKQLMPNIEEMLQKQSLYLDLELTSDRGRLSNPELFLRQEEEKIVILDEIQNQPELFPLLRALIDQNRQPGRFIILGSASPSLLRQSSESLAGRISYHELSPLNLLEVIEKESLQQHWFRGGLPSALLAPDDVLWKEWMQNFIRTYVERDLVQLGLNISASFLVRFLTMLANYQGGLWNATNFSKSLGVSRPTINNYLDFLEEAFLIYRLRPFHKNIKKRLVKSPKVYIRDSGMLHYLVKLDSRQGLLTNVISGNSWEGYVVEQIRQLTSESFDHYFYRTHDGSEVDLVLAQNENPVATVEVKFSLNPSTTKGYSLAIQDLDALKNYIIIPQEEEYYPIKENVFVVGLVKFLRDVLPDLKEA